MGWTVDQAQRIIHLMDKEDQERYDQRAQGQEAVPPPKTDRLERDQQKQFANWLLLQRSKGRKLPFVWHAMHKPSTASPGCPDFGVGCWQGWLWIEFKRDYSCTLSGEQQEFFNDCKDRGIDCYLVYSADEAIKVVNERDALA